MARVDVRLIGRAVPARLALLLVLAAGASPSGRQAAAMTLDEALTSAYGTNPQLASARAALRRTDELVPQALAGRNATVTGSVGGGYQNKKGLVPLAQL